MKTEKIINLNGKDLLDKTKFSIGDVNNHDKGLVIYKIVLKYEGKQLTTTFIAISGKKINTEEVMYDLLESYVEYSYLTDFSNNRARYEGASKKDLDQLYKESKRVKEGLERLYGVTNLKKILNYFNMS